LSRTCLAGVPPFAVREELIVQRRAAHNRYDRIDFMMQLFKPKFISLVNDDEKHFIVRSKLPFIAFRKLRV
jgi:hypothetical protein